MRHSASVDQQHQRQMQIRSQIKQIAPENRVVRGYILRAAIHFDHFEGQIGGHRRRSRFSQ